MPTTNQLGQGLAGDELHHDEVDAVDRLDLVNRDDVRMVERGSGARLLNEAPPARLVGEAIVAEAS